MIIIKTTVGWVTQPFDTDTKKFIGQEFVASDDVTWETESGHSVNPPTIDGETEPYLNFEMVQPNPNQENYLGNILDL